MTLTSRRTLLLAGGGMVATMATGLSGCTTSPRPSGPSSPPPPPVVDEPALPTLRPASASGVSGKPLGYVDQVVISGDNALITGTRPGDDTGDLLAIRLSDGKVLWTYDSVDRALGRRLSGADLFSSDPVVAGSGSTAAFAFQYYRSPCPDNASLCRREDTKKTAERGLGFATVASGDIRGTGAVLPAVSTRDPRSRELDRATLKIADSDVERVLINRGPVETLLGDGSLPAGRRVATSAVDATRGRRLWTADGVVGSRLVGSLVLGTVATPTSRGLLRTLVSLDARTGRRLWTSAMPGRWIGAVEQVAAVTLATADGTISELIDPRSQRHLAALPTEPSALVIGNGADGQPLAAWTTVRQPGQLFSFAHGRGRVEVGTDAIPQAASLAEATIRRGRIWLTDSTADEVLALDRSGRRVADPVPGHLLAVDDRWLVVGLGGTRNRRRMAVHRLD